MLAPVRLHSICVDPGLRSSVRMSEKTPSNHVRMAFPQTYVARVCRSASRRQKRQKGAKGGKKIRKFWKKGGWSRHRILTYSQNPPALGRSPVRRGDSAVVVGRANGDRGRGDNAAG